MKPTKTAPPRLLPNGQPDQSNVVFSDQANAWVLARFKRLDIPPVPPALR